MTKVSARSKRFWDKLRDWYGTSLTDQYGLTPPPDWCEIVDGASNEVMRAAMSEIRHKHVTFPPRLPEFDAIVMRLKRPTFNSQPSTAALLAKFVLRTKKLRGYQLHMPWRYLHDADGFVVGVEIPPDGETPGYRVMVNDMQPVA